MEKVQALEIHRESANEQVLHDIVFQPLPEESPTRRRRSSRARASTATQGKIRPTTATSEPDGSSPETTLQPIREWEEPVLDYALKAFDRAKQNRKPR
jgi:hypothetical protein